MPDPQPMPPLAALAPRPSQWQRGTPVPITAMDFGQILDAAVNLYRLHWKTLMAVAAYVVVPLAFLQGAWSDSFRSGLESIENDPETVGLSQFAGDLLVGLLFVVLQFLFVYPFLTAAFAHAASVIYLGGTPDVRGVYRVALSKLGAVLLVTFLAALAAFGGFFLLIFPAIIFWIRFGFGPAIVVVEDIRGTEAMRRSWRLVKGYSWRVFGILVVAGIIASIVGSILSIPLTLLGTFLGDWGWILISIGEAASQVITQPFTSIVTVLLYFDLRIRKEAFDLALMAQELGSDDA